MGIPQNPKRSLMLQTSAQVLVGARTTGSVMKPFSNLVRRLSQLSSQVGTAREAVLLHGADHASLEGRRHVVVDDSEATKKLWARVRVSAGLEAN